MKYADIPTLEEQYQELLRKGYSEANAWYYTYWNYEGFKSSDAPVFWYYNHTTTPEELTELQEERTLTENKQTHKFLEMMDEHNKAIQELQDIINNLEDSILPLLNVPQNKEQSQEDFPDEISELEKKIKTSTQSISKLQEKVSSIYQRIN